MPRAISRELPLDLQLDAVARRDQRIAELNRPADLLPGPVGTAEPMPAPPVTKLERAVVWLTQALADGPLPQRDVQARARIAGFTRKTKVAKNRAGVKSIKDGVRRWLWALPGKES
jgi:hypothetical protein